MVGPGRASRAQRGDPASALEWIGKAVVIDPQNAAYQFNLGKALLQLKRPRDACAALERATALDSAAAAAEAQQTLLTAEQELAEAQAALERAQAGSTETPAEPAVESPSAAPDRSSARSRPG